MASIYRVVFRNLRLFRNLRRHISYSAAVRSDDNGFPDPLEHATGLEKKELLAELAGNTDPFMNDSINRRENTSRDDPILVPSAFDKRIIGCICDEENTYISYLALYEGEPKRCECGYWFKLYRKTPITD